jgi:hypothetical protein
MNRLKFIFSKQQNILPKKQSILLATMVNTCFSDFERITKVLENQGLWNFSLLFHYFMMIKSGVEKEVDSLHKMGEYYERRAQNPYRSELDWKSPCEEIKGASQSNASEYFRASSSLSQYGFLLPHIWDTKLSYRELDAELTKEKQQERYELLCNLFGVDVKYGYLLCN